MGKCAAFLTLIALVALPGCGGSSDLNGAALSADIEDGLKRQNRVREAEVSCPAKIERKARSTVTCPFRTDRVRGTIKVFQQDDQGSVRWEVDLRSVERL